MASSAEHVLAVVRRQILSGDRAPGARISEASVAKELSVSRTPARVALTALETEGLIAKRNGRGYTVGTISAEDVAKAIDVRAVLEGLAAATMARVGISHAASRRLLESIEMTTALLERPQPEGDFISGYQQANRIYHETVMFECGNDLIAHTYERIRHLPLAALGTLAFDEANLERERMRLTVGHSQHVIIYDAIRQRDAGRAEAMMREHSHATLNYTDLFVRKRY